MCLKRAPFSDPPNVQFFIVYRMQQQRGEDALVNSFMQMMLRLPTGSLLERTHSVNTIFILNKWHISCFQNSIPELRRSLPYSVYQVDNDINYLMNCTRLSPSVFTFRKKSKNLTVGRPENETSPKLSVCYCHITSRSIHNNGWGGAWERD